MAILALLIPLSLLLVAAALGVFVWAAHHGQFDALDSHATDIFDDPAGPGEDEP